MVAAEADEALAALRPILQAYIAVVFSRAVQPLEVEILRVSRPLLQPLHLFFVV